MSILERWEGKGPTGFGYASTAEEVTAGMSLAGKTVLVTGCNSGLGLEAMRVLALRGARVVGTARTKDKAQAACDSVEGNTVPLACELSDPASVRACVESVKSAGIQLDAIICNLDQLTETGRVVMVSSSAHNQAPKGGVELDNLDGAKGYRAWRAYGQSKISNILFAKALARRFDGTKRTANAIHPGAIPTNLGRNMNPVLTAILGIVVRPFAKSVQQGAATEVFVATHPSVASVSGEYFADCNLARARPEVDDAVLATRLWEASEKIVAGLA